MGNLGNWLQFGGLAHGELLVKADGDDVSFPERTARIVAAWMQGGKRAKIVSHRGLRFEDETLRSLGPTWQPSAALPLGACQAWTPDCWTRFDNTVPQERAVTDDFVFAPRAMAISQTGEEVILSDILVCYRVGNGISTKGKGYREPILRTWRAMENAKRIVLAELKDVERSLPEDRFAAVRHDAERDLTRAAAYAALLGGTFRERWRAFRALGNVGWRGLLLNVAYLLPRKPGDVILNAFMWLKRRIALMRYGEKIVFPTQK